MLAQRDGDGACREIVAKIMAVSSTEEHTRIIAACEVDVAASSLGFEGTEVMEGTEILASAVRMLQW